MALADDLPIPAELAVEHEPFDDDELGLALELGALESEDPDTLTDEARRRQEVHRWVPTDTGAAEWAMRKLAEVDRNRDAITVQAAEWQARIDRWHDRMVKALDTRAEFFGGTLTTYGIAERQRTGQATVHLPSGSIQTTDRKARPKVADREAAAESAAANLEGDDLAAVVETPKPPAPVAKATELAKRVRIVDEVVRRCYLLTLEGDVQVEMTVPAGEPAPEPGQVHEISDGIDDRDLLVLEVEEGPADTVQAVVWADTGQPVAGVVVEPARIDCSVKLRPA